jgi:hypothetical protein
MIAGSAGMCAYAACLVPLLRRRGAAGAAAMALPVWFLVAGAVATAIMLG